MNDRWWFGPYRPSSPLNRDQQLVVHCRFSFTKDPDEVNAAVNDFPSFLRQELDDALAMTGKPGIVHARQLLAAGLLTYGRIDMVDVILDNMPPELSPNAATGYCIAAPSNILSHLLPLPDALKTRGMRGIIDVERVREWFVQHRRDLEWNPESERFHLVMERPG